MEKHNLIWHEGEQGTEDWHELRRGHITASNSDLLMVNEVRGKKVVESAKSGTLGDGLKTYLHEKVKELLLTDIEETYISDSMQWGIDNEYLARKEYEKRNLVEVQEYCFIEVEEELVGISPDGIIKDHPFIKNRGLEIKNFKTINHLEIIRTNEVPKKAFFQCQFSMMVTGFEEWDFVSFDRRLPENLQYFQATIERDEKIIEIMRKKVIECNRLILEEFDFFENV